MTNQKVLVSQLNKQLKVDFSSLHWLIIAFFYALFIQWSIFPTSEKKLSLTIKMAFYCSNKLLNCVLLFYLPFLHRKKKINATFILHCNYLSNYGATNGYNAIVGTILQNLRFAIMDHLATQIILCNITLQLIFINCFSFIIVFY